MMLESTWKKCQKRLHSSLDLKQEELNFKEPQRGLLLLFK
jgi:hypothetical protein